MLKNTIKILSAFFLLHALCACGTPNTVDYSYVPPTTAISVASSVHVGVGIDDEF